MEAIFKMKSFFLFFFYSIKNNFLSFVLLQERSKRNVRNKIKNLSINFSASFDSFITRCKINWFSNSRTKWSLTMLEVSVSSSLRLTWLNPEHELKYISLKYRFKLTISILDEREITSHFKLSYIILESARTEL